MPIVGLLAVARVRKHRRRNGWRWRSASAQFCCTRQGQLTFLRADRPILAKKDILNICNQPDKHMDFATNVPKLEILGDLERAVPAGGIRVTGPGQVAERQWR